MICLMTNHISQLFSLLSCLVSFCSVSVLAHLPTFYEVMPPAAATAAALLPFSSQRALLVPQPPWVLESQQPFRVSCLGIGGQSLQKLGLKCATMDILLEVKGKVGMGCEGRLPVPDRLGSKGMGGISVREGRGNWRYSLENFQSLETSGPGNACSRFATQRFYLSFSFLTCRARTTISTSQCCCKNEIRECV